MPSIFPLGEIACEQAPTTRLEDFDRAVNGDESSRSPSCVNL
jgi:hypothetical protein